MKLLGELKRRNVFKIGMAYIVGSWVMYEAGHIIAANLAAPEWVMPLVLTLLVLGLPFALFMAWSFALTTQGLRKESDVQRIDSLVRKPGHVLDVMIMALLAAVVGMVLLDRYLPAPAVQPVPVEAARVVTPPEPDPIIEENTIAVLPFVNMSAEGDQDYFSDGLSEELLNVLTQVDGLKVASRTSSFVYKNDTRNIRQIARQLRVANILEGSVRRVGNRLRVTAQLIDTSDDRHLWSDSYDRDMNDIFQVQDEIANAIVSALTTELGVGLQMVSVESATSNLDAYDLYLRARELFIARENLPTSWQLLEQAVHLDPQFARAWEALAAVRSVAISWFPGDGIDHDSLALAAAHRALEIDPDLSMAYAVIGMEHETTGEGYAGAIRNLDKAIENDSKNATAWLWRGITFNDMGYIDKALADFDQCLSIDAGYIICKQYRALSLLALGRIEDAIAQYEATIEDNFHSTDGAFVPYYVHSGQREMALAVAALSLRKQFAPIKYWIEAIENPNQDHSARVDRFNEWGATYNMDVCDMDYVAIALKQEQCYSTFTNAGLMWQPDAASYRKTQAFKNFVNTHLMEFWQENGFPSQCRDLGEGDFSCD
jgi:TolB-like protein/tetratricopeptide (TPR) repeat protein